MVMFVFREEYYLSNKEPRPGTDEHVKWQTEMDAVHGKAEVIIGKQRHGPTGTVKLQFDGARHALRQSRRTQDGFWAAVSRRTRFEPAVRRFRGHRCRAPADADTVPRLDAGARGPP